MKDEIPAKPRSGTGAQDDAPRLAPDFARSDGVKDAIVWLLKNYDQYEPDHLAAEMARELI